jgi:hypothetical protein
MASRQAAGAEVLRAGCNACSKRRCVGHTRGLFWERRLRLSPGMLLGKRLLYQHCYGYERSKSAWHLRIGLGGDEGRQLDRHSGDVDQTASGQRTSRASAPRPPEQYSPRRHRRYGDTGCRPKGHDDRKQWRPRRGCEPRRGPGAFHEMLQRIHATTLSGTFSGRTTRATSRTSSRIAGSLHALDWWGELGQETVLRGYSPAR